MKTERSEFLKLFDELHSKHSIETGQFCEQHGYTATEAFTLSLSECSKQFRLNANPRVIRKAKLYTTLCWILPAWIATAISRLIYNN